MPPLQINFNGKLLKLEYTDRYDLGIYLVHDNAKLVKQNMATFKITLTPKSHQNEVQQTVSKLGNKAILTTCLMDHYFQYIFMDSANPEAVKDLISQFKDESMKKALRDTYNLTKMNTMEDLDLLGGSLDNVN